MYSFTEVMRQARRMCKIESKKMVCNGCPRKGKSCIPKTNATFDLGDDEAYERDVMQWAAEHPEPKYPTWYEWQQANFEGHTRWICPMAFAVPCPCKSVTSIDGCTKCRNNQIPAHIAEKLGIKPIGGEKDG